jgi:protein-S-isoprenylcysteine O-methyltransferase Ste14
MAVFVGATAAIAVYLALKGFQASGASHERGGPTAEREKAQKVIMSFAMVGFTALLVFPALDHRFGWSPVPPHISLAGDVLVALGVLFTFFVLRVIVTPPLRFR